MISCGIEIATSVVQLLTFIRRCSSSACDPGLAIWNLRITYSSLKKIAERVVRRGRYWISPFRVQRLTPAAATIQPRLIFHASAADTKISFYLVLLRLCEHYHVSPHDSHSLFDHTTPVYT